MRCVAVSTWRGLDQIKIVDNLSPPYSYFSSPPLLVKATKYLHFFGESGEEGGREGEKVEGGFHNPSSPYPPPPLETQPPTRVRVYIAVLRRLSIP